MVYGNKIKMQFMFILVVLKMEYGWHQKKKLSNNYGKIILRKN
jgi:hypothetical protein